ncbi:spexin [Echinops telfairi]|uniref:Spexin n=1 Tax=Echinops telfairi TaxID=9371 RepID=A0ABM0ZT41_ECHTE|nr:spexin [Echinops telfairi]
MALTLFLVLAFIRDSSSAPQRLLERRNWTPQAMLYLKGAQRRNPDLQPRTLPEAAALLLASFKKPQEVEEENFDQTRFLEDSLLTW